MLEKLAKQTAIYGISTIVVRFLSYLLTPIYTYTFTQAEYGIVTDIYALIPFALVLLSMGMESSYFRFAAKAEEAGGTAEQISEGKRKVFATTWGATIVAASLFFAVVMLLLDKVAEVMGAAYVAHPEYVILVVLIILLDVAAMIPFSRLREQGRALKFVMLKALNVFVNVGLAITFMAVGLFDSEFGVGWVFVANLVASIITLVALIPTTERTVPTIDKALLRKIFAYSLPLLIGGVAGTAGEFLDRQMIKYILPEDISMAQLGVYGAITKIAVVMTLFTQMYRLAAEPFFLANFSREEFKESAAAAMKYFVMVSMAIFLGITLFRDLFALIVGRDFREGVDILPIILAGNILSGVWLNLSFWYKREEKTRYAVYVTFAGLGVSIVACLTLIPLTGGYAGAAWARLAAEAAMVGVSYLLMRRYYPVQYDVRRIAEYVVAGIALYIVAEVFAEQCQPTAVVHYGVNAVLMVAYFAYAVWREKIDLRAMVRAILKRRV
ncbi:MAG: oligosaccharide flippase family protein [Alistipes sp.]|nr:oligosaccharide flippase family protein [Alistipes sp.]